MDHSGDRRIGWGTRRVEGAYSVGVGYVVWSKAAETGFTPYTYMTKSGLIAFGNLHLVLLGRKRWEKG